VYMFFIITKYSVRLWTMIALRQFLPLYGSLRHMPYQKQI